MLSLNNKLRTTFLILVCFLIGLFGLYLPKEVYATATDNIEITKTEHEISFNWLEKPNQEGLSYELQRDNEVIGTIDYGMSFRLDDRRLVSNTTYNYKIYEITADGRSLIYNTDISTDKDTTPPSITLESTVNPSVLNFNGNGLLYKDGVAKQVFTNDLINEDGLYTLVVRNDNGEEVSKNFIIDYTPPGHAELIKVNEKGDYAYLTVKRPSDPDFEKMEIYSGGIKTIPNLLKVITKDEFNLDGTYTYLQNFYNLTKGPETLNIMSYDTYGNRDFSSTPNWQGGPDLNLPGAFFEIKQSSPIFFTSPKIKSVQQVEGGFSITLEIPAGTSWGYLRSNKGYTDFTFNKIPTKTTTQVVKFPIKNPETNTITPIGEKEIVKYEIALSGFVNDPVYTQVKSNTVYGSFNYIENNYRLISPKFLDVTKTNGAALYSDKYLKKYEKRAPKNMRFIVIREDKTYVKIANGANVYYVKKSEVKITNGINQKKTTTAAIPLKLTKSTSSRSIKVISKNKQVIVLQKFTGWNYVNVDGNLGYMVSKYLK
ncbi:hypothetical protein ACFWM3_23195 [Gottfriedia sp. NPDC058432]|uniref:hypothetical protein n=1 Tax=Gottfriedia sp. NPDC058432 TaxID=3346497 RepID=UPI003665708C